MQENINVCYIYKRLLVTGGFPGGATGKELPANARDTGDADSVPRLGISPGEGNGNPVQYSCLENPMDRGAWRATVRGITKNWTESSD